MLSYLSPETRIQLAKFASAAAVGSATYFIVLSLPAANTAVRTLLSPVMQFTPGMMRPAQVAGVAAAAGVFVLYSTGETLLRLAGYDPRSGAATTA